MLKKELNLRDYQKDMFDNIIKNDNSNKTFILCQAPTGAGKSVVIVELIKYYCIENNIDMIIITPRTELNNNIKSYFEELPSNLEIYTNLNKKDYVNFKRNSEKLVMLIDECHHSFNNSYQKKVEELKPNTIIGFSATPKAIYFGKRIDNDNFEYKNIYVPCKYSINDLIKNNYLSDYNYYNMIAKTILKTLEKQFNINYSELEKGDIQKNKTEKDISYYNFIKSIDINYILETLNKCKGHKTLIYCCNQEHIYNLSQSMKNSKYDFQNVYTITSKNISIRGREEILNNFEFLISCNILIEGINLPSVENIVLLRPTDSLIVYLQSIGRGMRKDNNNPNKKCNIYDFSGNTSRFGEVKNIKIQNPYDNSILCKCCGATLKKKVKKCPICGFENESIKHISTCPFCKEELDSRKYKICPFCDYNIEKHIFIVAKLKIYMKKAEIIYNKFPRMVYKQEQLKQIREARENRDAMIERQLQEQQEFKLVGISKKMFYRDYETLKEEKDKYYYKLIFKNKERKSIVCNLSNRFNKNINYINFSDNNKNKINNVEEFLFSSKYISICGTDLFGNYSVNNSNIIDFTLETNKKGFECLKDINLISKDGEDITFNF